MRDHTNRVCDVAVTVYRREQGPWRFGRKLDSEDGGKHLGEACRKARRRPTCAWGRLEVIHGTELPDRELGSCKGFLARGSNEE